MNTLWTRVWQFLLAASLLSFCYSAFAAGDAGGTALATTAELPLTTLLALLGCQAVAWAIRGIAPDNHFFHTKMGATAIAAITLVLSATIQAIQDKGLDKSAIELAAVNALLSFLTTGNPSIDRATNVSKRPDPPGLVMVAFLSLSVLGSFGCPSAGGQALGTCELTKLPQTAQTVITDVTEIAVTGGDNWKNQLEDLGLTLAPGQLACVVQAIAAAWTASKASLSPARKAALDRLESFLTEHPARACAPPFAPTPASPRG